MTKNFQNLLIYRIKFNLSTDPISNLPEKDLMSSKRSVFSRVIKVFIFLFLGFFVLSGGTYAFASFDTPVRDKLLKVKSIENFKNLVDSIFSLSKKEESKSEDKNSENKRSTLENFKDISLKNFLLLGSIDMTNSSDAGKNFNAFLKEFTGYGMSDVQKTIFKSWKSEVSCDYEEDEKDLCENFNSGVEKIASVQENNYSFLVFAKEGKNEEDQVDKVFWDLFDKNCVVRSTTYRLSHNDMQQICSFYKEFLKKFDIVFASKISNQSEVVDGFKNIFDSISNSKYAKSSLGTDDLEISLNEIDKNSFEVLLTYRKDSDLYYNEPNFDKDPVAYLTFKDGFSFVSFSKSVMENITNSGGDKISDHKSYKTVLKNTAGDNFVILMNSMNSIYTDEFLKNYKTLMEDMVKDSILNKDVPEKYRDLYDRFMQKYIDVIFKSVDAQKNIDEMMAYGVEFNKNGIFSNSKTLMPKEFFESFIGEMYKAPKIETKFGNYVTKDTQIVFTMTYPKRILDIYSALIAEFNPELGELGELFDMFYTDSTDEEKLQMNLFLGDTRVYKNLKTQKQVEDKIFELIEKGLAISQVEGLSVENVKNWMSGNFAIFGFDDENKEFVFGMEMTKDESVQFLDFVKKYYKDFMGEDIKKDGAIFCGGKNCFWQDGENIFYSDNADLLKNFSKAKRSKVDFNKGLIFSIAGNIDYRSKTDEEIEEEYNYDKIKQEVQKVVERVAQKMRSYEVSISVSDDFMNIKIEVSK
ncbi:MAG: hypothetical protein Fur0024_4210 [Patescibacteria group bacterium]